jgi:wyosine [tRNA(Phe)-imidazoG37] synthetase (radical SAM superfamily)
MRKKKTPIIYGPIKSRRAGNSLGINLSGTFHSKRICNFKCKYCQYKFSTGKGEKEFPSLDKICTEIDQRFKQLYENGKRLDSISFAGTGEPTLHPKFAEVVDYVCKQQDKYFPKTKVSIFSNSTTLNDKKVLEALKKLDKRIMKLDASDIETMQKINKFSGLSDIIEGLSNLSQQVDITISSMVISSPDEFANFSSLKSLKFISILRRINPDKLNLYTIDRIPAVKEIQQCPLEDLSSLKNYLLQNNVDIPVTITPTRHIRSNDKWV